MRFKAKAAEFATREKVIDVLAGESRGRGGPLSVLVKAFDEGRRVRVATRHRTGIRGVATAYVKAFDVYMNLVLQDVQETYSVRLRHTVEDPKRPGRTRVKYALEQRSRHMNQVFLRGEQVVTVAVEKDGDDFDDEEEEEDEEDEEEEEEEEVEEEKPRRGKVKSRGIDPVEEVGAAADEEPVQRFGAEITRARRARQTEQGGGAARGAWNPPPPPRPPAGRPPPPRPPPPRPPPGRPPPPRPPPGPPPGRR
jgi:small nuclear ribonucleoprotein (snRNP)-like protein